LAPITATADSTLQIGAGADWWMQWWVDGQPVFDTLGEGHAGNGPTPITGRDHIFTIQLAKGPHVLAVAVFGYPRFLFAVTSPQQPPVGRHLQFAACPHSARTAAVLSPLSMMVGIAGPQPGPGAHQPALKKAC
jgi:hypothetical protein